MKPFCLLKGSSAQLLVFVVANGRLFQIIETKSNTIKPLKVNNCFINLTGIAMFHLTAKYPPICKLLAISGAVRVRITSFLRDTSCLRSELFHSIPRFNSSFLIQLRINYRSQSGPCTKPPQTDDQISPVSPQSSSPDNALLSKLSELRIITFDCRFAQPFHSLRLQFLELYKTIAQCFIYSLSEARAKSHGTNFQIIMRINFFDSIMTI